MEIKSNDNKINEADIPVETEAVEGASIEETPETQVEVAEVTSEQSNKRIRIAIAKRKTDK